MLAFRFASRPLLGTLVGLGLCALTLSQAYARTLSTAYGDVEVTDQPERVVTLYEGALDTALAAGVTPLAAVSTRGSDGVASYLQDRVEDIAIVGTAREINIEAVVAQRPDMILAAPRLPEDQYQLLSRIAPTLVPASEPYQPDTWKEEARFFAQALGRESQIDEAISGIERRAAELSDQHPRESASLVRWMPQGALVMSPMIFSSTLLTASGFDVSDGGVVKQGRPHSDPLSLENLSRIDNDWLFLATLNAEGEQALASAKSSPAFARLDVVKRDQVVPVDGQLWTSATGPLAAEAILDDIEKALR
ncbi:iron-siderophore ABC transporter substrate-binding protein [Halomonas sp. McH1-25]|uniref:ABC transporter substrate-binding protein n=1 Tax=unclassified Halomonas TaxID=2609666 RepID=UPI001EF573B0|nr:MULTISPECIES: iron-siderophore ABC transporter substrate-binding protein [unclassified Halomonas]MCG7599220.1 iron-siderophore ABC transporter substrate-binding protein [Halomonas sp. McH1-25]MCP1341088.1 iron-siderophore ABC transporter substrate-binding protein [Halomonas sp. FL8]MCP1361692.1 iron-siderophore ABC transporter substrate-binding protein [Halomonas sp. BBD45]MCP1364176.1 iron-siderophore ABC transporter substrate-binding protein [Halomonas sp. BBD48]